jgi:8-hydroxy-5-deazaflavin:NADPH oxidoreductase
VVKALNTLNASLMVDPRSLGQSSTVFVSGDDADAKGTVVEILESFGHDDVIDLGGLETARGTEMLLPIWLRLMGALGTAHFNFKVVR